MDASHRAGGGRPDEARPDREVRRSKPATAFLFELIARLQDVATVPMIDVRAYASWLLPRGDGE